MQGDGQGNVIQMDPHEVTLFNLYQQQATGPTGRDRDDLAYTPEFDQLRYSLISKPAGMTRPGSFGYS